MRAMCFLAFLGSCWAVKSQSFHGRVLTESSKPIPFVNIGVKEKNVGTYSFVDGTYALSLEKVSLEDSLIFSIVGYRRAAFILSQIPDVVILEEDVKKLDDVIITPGPSVFFGIQKKKSSSDISINRPYNGAEVALLIEMPPDSFWIENVSINVRTFNIKEYTIRVKLYHANPNTGKPAELIDDINVLTKDSISEGVVYLTPTYPVPITGDFYISFEWLVEKNEAALIKELLAQPLPIFTKLRQDFPGHLITIYNKSRIEIEDQNGLTIKKIRLDKRSKRTLVERSEKLPVLKFQTMKGKSPTYYRSYSHGRWARYHQSLIAGVYCSNN